MHRPANEHPRLAEVVARWSLLLEAGHRVDPRELCEGDEQLERELAAVVTELERAELLVPPPRERLADALPAFLDLEILFSLGHGGMGEVFAARQRSLGRLVAVKVLHGPTSPSETQRFRREAQIAASLEHRHIVPVFAWGEERGRAYLVMKWLSGPSVDELEKPLAPREVARLGAGLASALDAAHASGVVHRDLKPANVLLDGREPVLVDFGLARAPSDATITRRGAVPGTLAYLAPELLAGTGERHGPRTDLYALGATLYELLAARPPFVAEDPQVLVRKISSEEPSPLALRGRDADLATIVMRLLEKDPARRIGAAGEVEQELGRYLRGEAIRSRRIGRLTRAARWMERHRRTVLPIAALALLLSIASVALALQLGRDAARRRDAESAVLLATSELDLPRAELLFAAYERDYGQGSQPALAHAVERLAAYEELLDRVQEHPDERLEDEIRQSYDRALAARVELATPRFASLACALAAHHLGEREAASQWVERAAREGRASDAGESTNACFRALLEGRSTPEESGALSRDAQEHFFAALALRELGAPRVRPERELDRALALAPELVRGHLARAIGLLTDGEPERAEEVLRTLLASGRAPWIAGFYRAWAAMTCGRLDEARALLDELPVQTGRIQLLRAELLYRTGDTSAAIEHLAAETRERPGGAPLHLLAGFLLRRSDRLVEARRAFESARERARTASQRDLAELGLLDVGVASAEREGADAAVFEALAASAARIESAAATRFTCSKALLVKGLCGIRTAGARRASASELAAPFLAAIEVEPEAPQARFLLLKLQASAAKLLEHEVRRAQKAGDAPSLAAAERRLRDWPREALRAALELSRSGHLGRFALSPLELAELRYLGARIARELEDAPACAPLAIAALESGPRSDAERQQLEEWKLWAERP